MWCYSHDNNNLPRHNVSHVLCKHQSKWWIHLERDSFTLIFYCNALQWHLENSAFVKVKIILMQFALLLFCVVYLCARWMVRHHSHLKYQKLWWKLFTATLRCYLNECRKSRVKESTLLWMLQCRFVYHFLSLFCMPVGSSKKDNSFCFASRHFKPLTDSE